VRGDTGPGAPASTNPTLAPTYSIITSTTGLGGSNNSTTNPTVLSQYCNGSRTPPEFMSLGYQVPPGIADATVPNPIFNLTPTATVDEGNNWINISWGPLALTNTSTGTQNGTTLGNYGPASSSSVINYIPSTAVANFSEAPSLDFYGSARKTNNAVDAGAVEFVAGGSTAIASVTGGPLAFGNQVVGTTSTARTLTLHNNGTVNLTGITVVVTAPFSRLGGTCGATLTPAAATCTITVVFSPTATGAATGSVTITANAVVTGSPVVLSGTGVAAVVAATLTPTSHAYPNQTRSATACGTSDFGCLTAPLQAFMLTNTGNVTLTGIAQAVLGGTNPTEFNVDRLVSTCGPTGGGQLAGQITLAPGGACVVTVAFHPLTSQTTGAKNATISVTDAAGTQTSTLTGTAQ
jgi:hypothetical protein